MSKFNTKVAELATIDTYLKGEFPETHRFYFDEIVTLPRCLDTYLIPKKLKTDLIKLYTETHYDHAPSFQNIVDAKLEKEELVRVIRQIVFNAIHMDEYEELIDSILDSPIAELLIYTLSDNGILSLREFSRTASFGNVEKSKYRKLEPDAILFTLFNSSEFESQVPSDMLVTDKRLLDGVLNGLVDPALSPFLYKDKTAKKLMDAAQHYTVFSIGVYTASKKFSSGSITVERMVMFEHILFFMDRHKEYLLTVDEEMFNSTLNIRTVYLDSKNAHPFMQKLLYAPLQKILWSLSDQDDTVQNN